MTYFVEQGRVLYGDEFLVYNVHSMLRLADVVGEFGSLDACSSFPFENWMQRLKRLVRSGKNPIAQIAKRMSEFSGEVVHVGEHAISLKAADNAFMLSDSSGGEVVDRAGSTCDNGEELFLCRIYKKTEPFFTIPCDSRLVGIHKATDRWTTMKVLSSQKLKKKGNKDQTWFGKNIVYGYTT